jgi:hypothetical protein
MLYVQLRVQFIQYLQLQLHCMQFVPSELIKDVTRDAI